MIFKMQVNNGSRSSIKSFPARELLLYWLAQTALGAALSVPGLDGVSWLKDFLSPLDDVLPTFKTAFLHSSAPVASKLYLVFWWLVILPWGFVFVFRWSDGFKPHRNGLSMSYPALLGLLIVSLFMAYMLGSIFSFHDHSSYWGFAQQGTLNRGNVIPFLMSSGPFALSIWGALSSFLFLLSVAGALLFSRVILIKLVCKGEK